MSKHRLFWTWYGILLTLSVVANWPRSILGSLKPYLKSAGLPWPFAGWEGGQLTMFDPWALTGDILLGVVGGALLAWLCVRSREARRGKEDSSN